MITVELLSFIKKELSSGKTKEQIKGELLVGGGWKSEDIDEAFNNLNTPILVSFPINSTEVSQEYAKITALRILVLLVLGAVSGLFYKGYIFTLLKIVPVREINNVTIEFITQFLSLTSFGFALVLALLIFYRKQSSINIWKAVIIILGSGIAFSSAIQLVVFSTFGNLSEDSTNMLFVLFFGLAGILGGGLMLLFSKVVVSFNILSFIALTLVSGIIGTIFGFINDPNFLTPTWQAIMLVGIISVSHKSLILNQTPKPSSIVIKIIATILLVLSVFTSMRFISSQDKSKEEKLLQVQADLKRDGYSVVRSVTDFKSSLENMEERYIKGYGTVPNNGSCLNAAEGSIFNMGSNFQPKEITNKEEFLGQRSHLYMSLKKYSLDIDRFGGFNHYAEVQCFSNQEHFAYLAPSYYEKDFPKFYCVDDIYPTVQVRYGKIKGPSCDDLDPNYIPPTERLIPDYGYYVFHKVTSLPEYENVILKDETENINNNSEEEKVESIEVKTETTEEVKVPVVTKPLSITPASTTPKPVVSNSTSLEPYEIRFISPSNGTKAQLEEMLTFKVEVGAKIKKVIVDDISYFYNPTDSPYSGIKSFEVPVYGGRADFATRIEGTLVPITFYLEGVADDQSAYLEAENKLTQSEVSKMFLEIKPFTNQPIEYFALETKSQEVNYINFKDEKSWVPQFIAGFPVHGIIAIPRDEVEYTISDPTVLKIDKDSVGPRYFMGLKNGSTSVIAKYKGMTQEIFYIVEYPPEE